jgi:hypothetical protein
MTAATARRSIGALALASVAACAGFRSTPATRYQGIVLNARELGVEELRSQTASDPTLRDYVARAGPPDFIYLGTPTEVELVYYRASKLVHFHREAPDGPSTVTELSPLPLEISNVLEVDLRAGTPGDIAEPGGPPHVNCWRVAITGGSCHTCCRGPEACSTHCG